MDKIRAKSISETLKGKTCSGWEIQQLINCGKSALVLKAQKGAALAAIKFFDPELVERCGAEIQSERIDREKQLIGKVHPNLVEILDGGFWAEEKLFFVVMEYLPWKNLSEVLPDVPIGKEREIISQVASAAQFLEGLEICHRDIKPENIGISPDFQKAKLLDLGVIRPHGTKGITDGTAGKVFVGTLKYSPPEFLLRKEENTPEGWRAISFYQLGGVLHDLIMRKSLFEEFETPFARLVNAVQHENPRIESTSVSPGLVELARHSLLKPPETRLKLVAWDSFKHEPPAGDSSADLILMIRKRRLVNDSSSLPAEAPRGNGEGPGLRLDQYSSDLQSVCRLESIEKRDFFPPVGIYSLVSTADVRQFAVQYEPSVNHALPVHLRLELKVRWIDVGNDVVEVLVGCCSGRIPFKTDRTYVATPIAIFQGVYSSDTVRRRIVTALYSALNQAQEVRLAAGEDLRQHNMEAAAR